MIPRSLRGRLIAAFAVLGLAILLTVGGALFLVLRGLHSEATQARLADVAESVGPQVRGSLANGDVRGTIIEIRDRLAAGGTDVLLVDADGSLRTLDGVAIGGAISISTDAKVGAVVRGGTTIDAERQLYAATVLRARGVLARAIAFVVPDRSGAQALGDVLRTIPAVVLIVLIIGAALAWLVSRSVTRPLRRLASAAAGLPDGPTQQAGPLPLEGPTEVRELTGTFNAMAGQLADLRAREGELLADLRHDLRTPLTVISGFAAALGDGTATGEDAARAARAIEEESGRLERLVAELGAIERLRSGAAGLRPEDLEAHALLAEARERFAAAAAAASIGLAIVEGPGESTPLRFAADRLAVERILANLVANALRVAAAGGHVWLEARAVAGPAGAPAVALSVTDDGPGFPPGTAGRAFERFYRADPSRSGGSSGLGLAIVQELAAAHGGTAHAENVAPHGARVSVVLPVVPRV